MCRTRPGRGVSAVRDPIPAPARSGACARGVARRAASAPVPTQWAFGEIASAPPAVRPIGTASQRARNRGTAADLTVAAILAFSCAAAGSRLLWPVLLIAAYYAAGVLLTGTSPMVALLSEEFGSVPIPRPPNDSANPPGAGRAGGERRLQASRLMERAACSRRPGPRAVVCSDRRASSFCSHSSLIHRPFTITPCRRLTCLTSSRGLASSTIRSARLARRDHAAIAAPGEGRAIDRRGAEDLRG